MIKKKLIFLWDVFTTSLLCFGGPEAHYAVFIRRLAQEKNYVTEAQIREWMGVFSLIPGPSSTQTMMAIGYAYGGKLLAFFTWIVWAFPAMIILSFLAYFYPIVAANTGWRSVLTYLPVLAVSFIAYAGWTMFQKLKKTTTHYALFASILFLGYLFQNLSFWVLPALLIFSGIFFVAKERETWFYPKEVKTKITLPLFPLLLFLIVTLYVEIMLMQNISSTMMSTLTFYRFGYSIIGGGQLVIPYMIESLVGGSIPLDVFLSGYAIDQSIPGPLFSFASFVGAFGQQSLLTAIALGLAAGGMIFLPGIFGVYIVFPIWKQLRERKFFQVFLQGVVVAVTSLIVLTAITQAVRLPLYWDVWVVFLMSLFVLIQKKINPFLLVMLLMLVGLIF